ncbi:hypothetical protein I7I50_12698 [Histoplasma capsulatum G186AR]|uniref:Uncharacterized protein n=1 Tax=Ajellomyces capsulatus TaxID=5037 RepID=A0A8H7Y7J3_AJECA|nr:hypothetical protein I7I52_10997 [Histoplasma capsulatum]QSS70915.1 hypothetical protein I7I50_12698 [Histoplasma capsulatum G186AR]
MDDLWNRHLFGRRLLCSCRLLAHIRVCKHPGDHLGNGGEEEGPNCATIRSMAEVNTLVGVLLSAVEIRVLRASMLANLSIGEMNQLST